MAGVRRGRSGSTLAGEDLCAKCTKGSGASGEQWIQCDICEAWFHNSCSGLPVDLIPQVVKLLNQHSYFFSAAIFVF